MAKESREKDGREADGNTKRPMTGLHVAAIVVGAILAVFAAQGAFTMGGNESSPVKVGEIELGTPSDQTGDATLTALAVQTELTESAFIVTVTYEANESFLTFLTTQSKYADNIVPSALLYATGADASFDVVSLRHERGEGHVSSTEGYYHVTEWDENDTREVTDYAMTIVFDRKECGLEDFHPDAGFILDIDPYSGRSYYLYVSLPVYIED